MFSLLHGLLPFPRIYLHVNGSRDMYVIISHVGRVDYNLRWRERERERETVCVCVLRKELSCLVYHKSTSKQAMTLLWPYDRLSSLEEKGKKKGPVPPQLTHTHIYIYTGLGEREDGRSMTGHHVVICNSWSKVDILYLNRGRSIPTNLLFFFGWLL